MKKTLLLFLAFAAGTYLYTQQKQTQVAPVTEPTSQQEITEDITQENVAAQILLNASVDGQTALELLEAKAESIETKDYGEAGVFVTSINGVAGDNEHYWAFYVNDEYAQQGVSQTVLESGDIVTFVYEEISQAEF